MFSLSVGKYYEWVESVGGVSFRYQEIDFFLFAGFCGVLFSLSEDRFAGFAGFGYHPG